MATCIMVDRRMILRTTQTKYSQPAWHNVGPSSTILRVCNHSPMKTWINLSRTQVLATMATLRTSHLKTDSAVMTQILISLTRTSTSQTSNMAQIVVNLEKS